MARPIDSLTMPLSISQSKKVSPASPDQSVPSQSKAATFGFRRNTDSMNCCAAGWSVGSPEVRMPFDNNVGGAAGAIAKRELREFKLRIFRFSPADSSLVHQRRIVLGRIDIHRNKGIVHHDIPNAILMPVFDFARRGR